MSKSVICHLFYPVVATQLIKRLKELDDGHTTFFINVQGNSLEHRQLLLDIRQIFPLSKVMMTSNKGRDIGAKLLLISLLIQLQTTYDYTLIIHDKKSPHLSNGDIWRDELFKIIEPRNLGKVFQIFEEEAKVGIVCSGKFIQNEYNEATGTYMCNSNKHLKELQHKYNIETTNHDFVAGNIFWIRTSLLKNFFDQRSILAIRSQLEEGNALDFDKGTYIHSWERIMSWIATSQEYSIYGI